MAVISDLDAKACTSFLFRLFYTLHFNFDRESWLNIAVNIILLIYSWTSRSSEKPMDEPMYAPEKEPMDVGKKSDRAKKQEIHLRMSEAILHREDQFFANPGYAPWHQRLTKGWEDQKAFELENNHNRNPPRSEYKRKSKRWLIWSQLPQPDSNFPQMRINRSTRNRIPKYYIFHGCSWG